MNDTTSSDTPNDAGLSSPIDNSIDIAVDAEVTEAEVPGPPLPPPPPRPDGRLPLQLPQPSDMWSKSPALAAFLSLVIGLGHLYVGAYQRAAMLVIGFFAIIYLLPLPLNVFMCLFLWFFGIFDAYRQAQLVNLGDDQEVPARYAQSNLMFGVFLTVLGTVLLLNNFFPIDFEWLRDWWPAVVVAAGLYLIAAAAFDRNRSSRKGSTETTDFLE